jgi:predicted kinase
MPSLVLLNGPPASGKSTVAEVMVHSRPLALNLDLDLVRGLLGSWRNEPENAGLAARHLALSMVSTHLDAGYDVIVPQFLAREQFIDQLANAAVIAKSRFIEIALMLNRAEAIKAFQQRSASPGNQQHRDAAEMVEESGGLSSLEVMYDQFSGLIELRPNVHRVKVVVGDIAATVRVVESAVLTAQ